MSKPTTPAVVEFITKTRAAITEAATLSARSEAALVVAETELAAAVLDDGVIDVQVLHDRSEAARKNFSLRRIEANRAGAKLSELEGDFHAELEKSAEPMILTLYDAAAKTKAEILVKLASQVLPDLVHESALPAYAACCIGVADRERAADTIRRAHHMVVTDYGTAEGLALAIEDGAAVL
jgi:hypothetical protein